MDEPQSLRALFEAAEVQRQAIETSTESSTSASYVSRLESVIALYTKMLEQMSAASLFSPNEGVEDIATSELPFLLTSFHLAELVQRLPSPSPPERLPVLRRSRLAYDSFLNLVDAYGLIGPPYDKMLERYRDDADAFSVVPAGSGAAARRDGKIAGFKAEKQLRDRLEVLRRNPRYVDTGDEELVRQLHLTNVTFRVHTTFDAIDSLNRELDMLRNMPATAPPPPEHGRQETELSREDADLLRLDQPLRQRIGNPGPLLSKQGKPLQPFTLLGSNSRAEMSRGVFRPGHNLPTMSIDEYLDEEKRRGNILQGGVEPRTVIDEDDVDAADRETYKAREWDEFKDHNPKGAGNTMNMG
ncbi:hypothetical protein GMORB2_0529 [Geosmithia morbida]|uniref:TAP42-like protein n=1 Tax=Geosmithia morbida TaxID=1094350 RepID=A0A9P4Z263_9HYPO|nr:uncharacterized protein GMORB2_0529 [Geosmithia morbida]KAF4126792.1 hypothetical protein GMORB2_0529 [Geosmithia morbida]